MRLPEISLRHPVTVMVAAAAILLLGAVSVTRLPLEFFPKMEFPFIGVYAPYENSVPSVVETQVARPIEEVLATLGDVRELHSESDRDGAFVWVQFDFGRSVDVLRMEVKEKMDQARPLLPADLRDYFIFTFNTNDLPILVFRISAKGRELVGSYDLIEQRILNPLRRINGVGRVQMGGLTPPEVAIYLNMDRLLQHQVDVGRLFRRLNANNMDLSAGRVRDGRQRVAVRALGQFRDLDELKNMRIGTGDLRLQDVADVIYGEPAPSYRRRLNGEPAVAVEIQKASGANTVEVTRQIHKVLSEIDQDPSLSGIEVVTFFDQGEQITKSLRDLLLAGLVGSIMSVLVLLVFLKRIRPTLIISLAIPFSVISTCVFLFLTSRSLNLLTMAGLMLAVGMLVDNAIVVLESIYHRQERGLPAPEAARIGSQDVARAVTAATLTSIIVFAPLFLSRGNEMVVFLSEIGVTIAVTLAFSLLSCLTLVPLLAARRAGRPAPESRYLSRLRDSYTRALGWTALRHPKITGLGLLPLAALLTVGLIQATGFKPEPDSDRGIEQEALYVGLEFKDNCNLYAVESYIEELEAFLLPRLDSLGVETLYDFYTDNLAELALFFPKGESPSEEGMRNLRKRLRETLPPLAGVEYRLGGEEEVGRGAKKVSVTLFGEDSERLKSHAAELERRLALLPGLEDVRSDVGNVNEEVHVSLDRSRAARYGVDPSTVSEILNLTFRGLDLRDFRGSERDVPMSIVLEPTSRTDLDNLRTMPVTFVEGRRVELGQVARFDFERGASRIRRDHQKTAVTVQATYEGEKYGEMLDTVRGMMKEFELPPGYAWSFGRDYQAAQAEQNELGLDMLLAVLCIYFVLASLFESLLHPLVIMLCVPFAGLGVIWTLIATNTPMNVMAMIGMIILIGVVVNNGIVLIDHINALRRRGMSRSEAILAGGRERFRPIIMTAATTILGLLPLALGSASVGQAQYYPLARTMIGGLAAGTILTLLILPTFYVLAESGAEHARATVRWALGKGPLPWAARGRGIALR